jgi:ArsR family transcriptional regulator, virulence genes transcriptional regulator
MTCVVAQLVRRYAEMDTTTLAIDLARTRAAAIAKALADPKRLCVVEELAAGERSVGDLSRCIGCQVPNMSQHLAVLRSAGVVESRREGSTVFYRLVDPTILEAYRILQQLAR